MKKQTTIRLSKDLKEKLCILKQNGETFEETLERLMDTRELAGLTELSIFEQYLLKKELEKKGETKENIKFELKHGVGVAKIIWDAEMGVTNMIWLKNLVGIEKADVLKDSVEILQSEYEDSVKNLFSVYKNMKGGKDERHKRD